MKPENIELATSIWGWSFASAIFAVVLLMVISSSHRERTSGAAPSAGDVLSILEPPARVALPHAARTNFNQ